MTNIVVTLCNNGARQPVKLLQISPEGEVTPVLVPSTEATRGATGCVRLRDGYLVAFQVRPTLFVQLDEDLKVVRFSKIDEIHDVHGLTAFEDGFLVTATGSNRVMKLSKDLKLEGVFGVGSRNVIDVDHLNDLCEAKGRVLLSQHGPRLAGGLRNGSIRDLRSGEVLWEGFNEPHSLVAHGGRLHMLDSGTGRLFQLIDGLDPIPLLSVTGYARGLAMNEESIVIGRSIHRRQSRQSGFQHSVWLTASDAEAASLQESGVFVYARSTGKHRFVATTAYGPEVYSVVLPKAPARRAKTPAPAPA